MIHLLRLPLILFFLLCLPSFSFAQDTTRCLIIERLVNGKLDSTYGAIRLNIGDPVIIRTNDDRHLQTGTITAITDSTVLLSSIHAVVISHITEIRWDPKNGRDKLRGASVAVSSLASALFAFYQFAHGTGSLIGVYIVGGIALVTIAIVSYLSYRSGKIVMKQKRHFKNGNWKLSSVQVNNVTRFHRNNLR